MIVHRHEPQPPAATDGSRLVLDGGRLIARFPALDGPNVPVSASRILSTSSLRDGLGLRTVIQLADMPPGQEEIVLAQDYAEACRLIDEARRAAGVVPAGA